MKIKELITMLQKFDQDLEVYDVGWDSSVGPAKEVLPVHYDGYHVSRITELSLSPEQTNGVIIE